MINVSFDNVGSCSIEEDDSFIRIYGDLKVADSANEAYLKGQIVNGLKGIALLKRKDLYRFIDCQENGASDEIKFFKSHRFYFINGCDYMIWNHTR